jgi:PIN domain nuclease of toxin-antitoxin system
MSKYAPLRQFLSSPSVPADRIIIASAREWNMTPVTRDSQILACSQAGYLRTLVC